MTKKTNQFRHKSYNVRKYGSGYAIFDQDGIRLSEDNVMQITIAKLEQLIRRDINEQNENVSSSKRVD